MIFYPANEECYTDDSKINHDQIKGIDINYHFIAGRIDHKDHILPKIGDFIAQFGIFLKCCCLHYFPVGFPMLEVLN